MPVDHWYERPPCLPAWLQVLCASNDAHDQVDPVIVPEGAAIGERIKVEGFDGEPLAEVNPKKKILEKLFPDMKTDASEWRLSVTCMPAASVLWRLSMGCLPAAGVLWLCVWSACVCVCVSGPNYPGVPVLWRAWLKVATEGVPSHQPRTLSPRAPWVKDFGDNPHCE